MPARPTTIGFVVDGPDHNCGVQPLVGGLCRRGWSVHVLLCGVSASTNFGAWRETGARIHFLDASLSPIAFRVPNLYEPSPTDHTDHIRHAVADLHRNYHFDVIEFGTHGGPASGPSRRSEPGSGSTMSSWPFGSMGVASGPASKRNAGRRGWMSWKSTSRSVTPSSPPTPRFSQRQSRQSTSIAWVGAFVVSPPATCRGFSYRPQSA
jgi:hypothetical protein